MKNGDEAMPAGSVTSSGFPPALPPVTGRPDSYFGWDQLILLLTPFPAVLIAKSVFILGASQDRADAILGLYLWPAALLSFATIFLVWVILFGVVLWLVVRNVRRRRFKRLGLYAVVLLALPLALRFTDADYLRFLLQQHKFERLVAEHPEPQAAHSAHCMFFDRVEDHFYIGGVAFGPYEKLILFVSPDLAGQENPRIDSYSSADTACGAVGSIHEIKHLRGRFYLADTFHG
jgi:hypothetical protein